MVKFIVNLIAKRGSRGVDEVKRRIAEGSAVVAKGIEFDLSVLQEALAVRAGKDLMSAQPTPARSMSGGVSAPTPTKRPMPQAEHSAKVPRTENQPTTPTSGAIPSAPPRALRPSGTSNQDWPPGHPAAASSMPAKPPT